MTGWKYDDKTKKYICKESACESFYRMIELPEEIKTDSAQATYFLRKHQDKRKNWR
jgi:HSP20 family molecular chaperone IbpA